MPDATTLFAFALIALGMVLTPGPNMVYLISRSICQGRRAGLISLGGVALGFILYLLSAVLGLTALLFAVPYAYDALRIAGALYLLYLAYRAIAPGGRSPFAVVELPHASPARLFTMGLLTNLLNPKIAVLYLALLPQFITPGHGSVLAQSLMLGGVQIAVSLTVNALVVLLAGSIAGFLALRPGWQAFQRYLMAGVLGGLALRLALEQRR